MQHVCLAAQVLLELRDDITRNYMKKIQLKYILLSILFWAMGSTVGGFSTVFMKEHGISNTEIGIVKGISCVLIILFHL